MKTILRFTPFFMIFTLMFCESFIPVEIDTQLLELEKSTYSMRKTVKVNDDILSKGQRIRIKVTPGKDWVKIRGYSVDENVLEAKRVLILYMFKEDFPDEKFSKEHLMKEFSKVATRSN